LWNWSASERGEIEKQLAFLAEPIQRHTQRPKKAGCEIAEALRELIESVVVHRIEPSRASQSA
jgi:hypothetical protein